MRLFSWLMEQRSTVAGVTGLVLFAICLITYFVFNRFWPWGIAMATICGFVAIFNFGGE